MERLALNMSASNPLPKIVVCRLWGQWATMLGDLFTASEPYQRHGNELGCQRTPCEDRTQG